MPTFLNFCKCFGKTTSCETKEKCPFVHLTYLDVLLLPTGSVAPCVCQKYMSHKTPQVKRGFEDVLQSPDSGGTSPTETPVKRGDYSTTPDKMSSGGRGMRGRGGGGVGRGSNQSWAPPTSGAAPGPPAGGNPQAGVATPSAQILMPPRLLVNNQTGPNGPPTSGDPGETVSNELSDLTTEQLLNISQEVLGGDDDEDQSGGGGGMSYAAATAKRPKEEFPYALYVQKGTERREAISRPHFDAFCKAVYNKRLKLSFEENSKFTIDWVLYKDGYGIFACADKQTAEWVKTLAADFQFPSGKEGEFFKTRGWNRWERGEALVFHGFLHGPVWKDRSYKAKYQLNTILKLNGLEGEFESLSWNYSTPNGAYILFEPIGELASKLENRGMRLNAGICTLKLNKRIRKQRSEADFVKAREQNDDEDTTMS